jgi:hypothetical protein
MKKERVKFEFDKAIGRNGPAPTDREVIIPPAPPTKHGLFGRVGKHGGRGYDGYGNQSRDAALIVPCERTVCPVNSSNHCSMPSRIKINAAGQCATGTTMHLVSYNIQ